MNHVSVSKIVPEEEEIIEEVLDLDNDGFTEGEGDCDDLDEQVAPDLDEVCDGVDNDCDGFVDGDSVCLRQTRFAARVETDVVLVLDATYHLDELRTALPDLLPALHGPGVDSRLAVINMVEPTEMASLEHSGVRPWVQGSDPLPIAQRWLDDVIRGLEPQPDAVSGLESLVSLFGEDAPPEAQNFFRPDAQLAVVFVSDQEMGTTHGLVPYLNHLDAFRGLENVTAHGVLASVSSECVHLEKNSPEMSLVGWSGGIVYDACEPLSGPFLSAIGQQIARDGLTRRYRLPYPAEPSSVIVHVELLNGELLAVPDFSISPDGQEVVLSDTLAPAGSVVVVDYSLPWPDPQ